MPALCRLWRRRKKELPLLGSSQGSLEAEMRFRNGTQEPLGKSSELLITSGYVKKKKPQEKLNYFPKYIEKTTKKKTVLTIPWGCFSIVESKQSDPATRSDSDAKLPSCFCLCLHHFNNRPAPKSSSLKYYP